ncbi:uncharacterized protein LOC129808450 [Phlebotomus papatasi]|uniref:uncharacterized protein LOC129808450 n=1 Tax=Phlebotomus papatasi TaxID=29031 RepID=UPI002483EE8E|nr:uncharacterized protein LOC129808450 [Phlebotomus papatasi]
MADITKMYHQLILHPEHTNFQRLVWREHETDPICDYMITRVGFGLGSSPFLATRALVQLAHEHQLTHSLASEAILKSFYVDDCLFSAESPTIMNETCLQLVDMLGKGGFVLAKWMFSHPSIQQFDSKLNATTLITDSTKALGLRWTASSDTFNFVSPIPLDQTKMTKRSIASDIAKIFDPLGLIGRVVVTAKIILQELHQLKGKWDDEVPAEYGHRWHTFSKSIQNVHHISVQRWISFSPSMSQLELRGFCDASTKAYGAAIYAITRHRFLKSQIQLIGVTYQLHRIQLTLYLEAFLLLWWSGPTWLTREEHEWPRLPNLIHQRPSEEFNDASISLTIANEQPFFETFIEKSSSLRTLQIRLAWCLRFAHNSSNTHSKRTGTLSLEELEFSLRRLIYLDQHQCFPKVILQLKIGRELPSSWKHLQPLSPYLDSEGLVRVGGRLEKSDESMEAKHPILLTKSKLQELIAINEHRRLLHAPPALLLASFRQRFWPIGGRNLFRKIVRQCYTCVRARPRPLDQIMGQLPAHRVVFNRPFHATAVDYAGHLMYKTSHLRNAKTCKGYICLFVCMSVKALHLELVTDMTTEAFLTAFRRFVSRRSAPRHMYSDCGTTFVGANKQLCQLYLNEKQIAAASADSGTIWHFNPPGAPHQGGLWEAGVKSVKYHLQRTLNQSLHTFEEISTMLHQIEATLNSRPISLMSDDPTENNYLTPGHFLVGAPLTSLPDPDLSHLQTNRMNRWQITITHAKKVYTTFEEDSDTPSEPPLQIENMIQSRAKTSSSSDFSRLSDNLTTPTSHEGDADVFDSSKSQELQDASVVTLRPHRPARRPVKYQDYVL